MKKQDIKKAVRLCDEIDQLDAKIRILKSAKHGDITITFESLVISGTSSSRLILGHEFNKYLIEQQTRALEHLKFKTEIELSNI